MQNIIFSAIGTLVIIFALYNSMELSMNIC